MRALVKFLFGEKTASTSEVHLSSPEDAMYYAYSQPGNYGVACFYSDNTETAEAEWKEDFLKLAVALKSGTRPGLSNFIPVRGQLGADKVIEVRLNEDEVNTEMVKKFMYFGLRASLPIFGPVNNRVKDLGSMVMFALQYPGIGFWCRISRPDSQDEQELLRKKFRNSLEYIMDVSRPIERRRTIEREFLLSEKSPIIREEMPKGADLFLYDHPKHRDGEELVSVVVGSPDGSFAFAPSAHEAYRMGFQNPHRVYYYLNAPGPFNTTFTLEEWSAAFTSTRDISPRNISKHLGIEMEEGPPVVGFCYGGQDIRDTKTECFCSSVQDAMTLAAIHQNYVFFALAEKTVQEHSEEFKEFKPSVGELKATAQPLPKQFRVERPKVLVFRPMTYQQDYVGFKVDVKGRGGRRYEVAGSYAEAMRYALSDPGCLYIAKVTTVKDWGETVNWLLEAFQEMSEGFKPIPIPQYAIKPFVGSVRSVCMIGKLMSTKFVLGRRPLQSDKAKLLNCGWEGAMVMSLNNPGHLYAVELNVPNAEQEAKDIERRFSGYVKTGNWPTYDLRSIEILGEISVDAETMQVIVVDGPSPERVSTIPTHTSLKTNSSEFNQEDMSINAATGAQRSKDADDFAYHLHHPVALKRIVKSIRESRVAEPCSMEHRLDEILDSIFEWLGGDDIVDRLAYAAAQALFAMEYEHPPIGVVEDDTVSHGYILIPPRAFARVSKVWRTGSLRYGTYNYERGMLAVECMNHCIKHIYDYVERTLGQKETGCDDLAHVVCNLFMAIQSWEFHPELNRGTRRGEGSKLTSDIIAKQEAFNFLKRHRTAFDQRWGAISRDCKTVDEMAEAYKKLCNLDSLIGVKEAIASRLFEEQRIK